MFLASNLEKPEENQCFWVRALNGCVPPFASAPSLARSLPQSLPPPFRREGTAHRQNLYTQTPDSPHLCGRLVNVTLKKNTAKLPHMVLGGC